MLLNILLYPQSGQKALSYEPFSLNEMMRARLSGVKGAVTEQRQSECSPARGLEDQLAFHSLHYPEVLISLG